MICIALIGGILAACLWPFNPHPHNDVSWSTNGSGLEFGDYGEIFGAFRFEGSEKNRACSFEIWMVPGLTYDSATIFAFYSPHDSREFKVNQTNDNLGVVSVYPGRNSPSEPDYIAVKHAFRASVPLLISLTSDGENAEVYFNGQLVKQAPFESGSDQFNGEFIFGNSPVENNSWSGKLKGLGFYALKLKPEEVLKHYQAWEGGNMEELATKELSPKNSIALYTFREGSGTLVHNQFGPGPDLLIPRHYQILHQELLVPAWKEYASTTAYWKDVLENIAGFAPLGFFLCAYGSSRRMRRPEIWTILFGASLSLAIEIIQSQLPMRDSSMTDVISNTLGTIIGVLFYAKVRVCRSF